MEKIIIANHKMNLDFTAIKSYIETMKKYRNEFVVCPSNIYIPYFINENFKVGIQNVFSENHGAYTGEVSPYQARSLGVSYVIVGHGERRYYFKEDDEILKKKIKKSIENKMNVVFCIGETKEERENNKTLEVIKKQLEIIDENSDIIISYEPIWAIGNENIPSNKEIEEVVNYIKKCYNVKVIYGGGITASNINELNNIKELDGYLVGSSSINEEEFLKILEVTRD